MRAQRDTLNLVRFLTCLLMGTAFVVQSAAQRGALDPEVAKVPFDQWLTEPDQLHFHWTLKVQRAELSFHQRLVSSIDIQLDGRDLQNRRHDGKLLLLIQITDAAGTKFQEHGAIELGKLDVDVKDAYLAYSQRAFFLPGDFQLAVVILDSATGEHATGKLTFHIAEPAREKLSEQWHNLPSVEYIGDDVSPESWYLPYIHSRLNWTAATHPPVQLNVIVNVTPSARAASDGLVSILPALKAIALPGAHVALVDLSRRKTVFEQDTVDDLDWPLLKAALKQANTASIDVHSLSDRKDNAQFFVTEVRRLVRASPEKPCVLVVLSKPIGFDSGADLSPVSLEALPACRVVYIRFHARPMTHLFAFGADGMGRRNRLEPESRMEHTILPVDFDQLAGTLKPLNPKVIDVETPTEVSKALSEIEKAILKAKESH